MVNLPIRLITDPKHKDFSLDAGHLAAVLVHGFPGTPFEMRPLAEILQADG